MANNRFQVKRTSVSGRTPNTTNAANNQYISAGEFALNMADEILYSSNGSVVIPIGANNINVKITGNLTVNSIIANGSLGSTSQYLTSNSSGGLYWSSPGTASVNSDATYTWSNTHTFQNTVYLNAISANGVLGSAGQVLTSNGSDTYWSTVTGGGGNTYLSAARVYQSFTASDGQTTFSVSGGYTVNSIDVYYNGVHLSNTEYTQDGSDVVLISAANNGAIVEIAGYSTNTPGSNTQIIFNDSGFLGANANFAFDKNATTLTVGNSSVNTQITPGNVFLNGSTLIVGNTATNVTINSSSVSIAGISVNSSVYSGTANNTNFVGSISAANVVSNNQLQSNLSNYAALSGATFSGNVSVSGTFGINSVIALVGSNGSSGQVLTSNGNSNVYWSTPTTGTVTSVASGNGISGGTITGSGTLYATGGAGVVVNASGINVLANAGIVANSLGVFTNQTSLTTTTINANLSASYANVSGQVNTATLYVTTSANVGSTVVANATGVFVSGNTVLVNNSTATIGSGFTLAPYNLGVVAANITANAVLGNYQYMTANGTFTITAPTSDCAIDVLLTNGSGANTISFSGFTVGSTTGDAYATTANNKFLLTMVRINSVATYIWKALQ